jgi:hypothetical protein
MCHNFHIRGSSCLFFCEKKVQWRKNNLQRVLLQGDQFGKKTSQRREKKRPLSHQRKKR